MKEALAKTIQQALDSLRDAIRFAENTGSTKHNAGMWGAAEQELQREFDKAKEQKA